MCINNTNKIMIMGKKYLFKPHLKYCCVSIILILKVLWCVPKPLASNTFVINKCLMPNPLSQSFSVSCSQNSSVFEIVQNSSVFYRLCLHTIRLNSDYSHLKISWFILLLVPSAHEGSVICVLINVSSCCDSHF